MSITPNPEMEVSLDDEEAEHLIARTDALIHRHESFAAPSETDDLPVLTDVVDERIEPYIGETSPIILEPVTPAAELPETRAEPHLYAASRHGRPGRAPRRPRHGDQPAHRGMGRQ